MSNFKYQISTNKHQCKKIHWTLDIRHWILGILRGSESGQSIVELLVAIGLATLFIPALLTGMVAARSGRAQDTQRTQAVALAKETQEAVRSIRNTSWATFAAYPTGQALHPVLSGTTWTLASGSALVNGFSFTRQVVLSPVYRDTNGNIATSGTLDPSIEQVAVTVLWSNPFPSSVTTTSYLARLTNNAYTDNTILELRSGTGASDWCNPNASGIVKYNLTGNGQWTAISAVAPNGATLGHAYTTFGFNQSGNPLDSVNVTDPGSGNPVATAGSSFTADAIKTYGLFADPTASYVYISSNSNKYQVDVVKTTDFSQHIATFNSSGGEPGYSVSVATVNNTKTGFVTAADAVHNAYKLYSFAVGNTPSGALSQNGNAVTLAGIGYKIVVIGNYAFVATSSTTSPLQIFNISNPSAITAVSFTNGFSLGSLQGASPQGAVDLSVDTSGRYVFIATNYVDSTHPDVFMVDVGTPSAPTIVGSVNTYENSVAMHPTGIIPVSGNHMVVVGSGGQEYQVFYIYPTVKYCGGYILSAGTKINAVAGVSETDGDNYAYILTDDSSGWFQIIPGGTGTGGVGGSGSFTSQPLPVPNLNSSATFNSFFPIADVPPPTTIAYQVAVAPTCAGPFTFIGPDKTSGTSFATSSAIPLAGPSGYQNPGKCFEYKVTMNANGSNALTPVLYQVSINYSP